MKYRYVKEAKGGKKNETRRLGMLAGACETLNANDYYPNS